jgi:predicted RNA binding protein YcfA (HicA-like mRNA interferase family)
MASAGRFAEVRKKLENAGWTLARVHGSHHIFTGEGRPLVSIPVHRGKVKAFYVGQVEKIIAAQGP